MLRYHAGDDESVMTNDNADTVASGDIFDNVSDGEAEYSDSDTDMELDSEDEDELGDVIKNKIVRLVDSNRDVYDQMVEQYVEDGMKIETAENQVHEEMLEVNRAQWLRQYFNLIKDIQGLKKNKIHRSVMDYVKKGGL